MAKYATVSLIKNAMGKELDTDDGIIDQWLLGVEAAIDKWCKRPDGFLAIKTATERIFTALDEPWVYIDECIEVTLVEVKDSADDADYVEWDADDWIAFKGGHQKPNFNETPYNGLLIDPSGNYSLFTSGQWNTRSGFPSYSEVVYSLPTVRVTAKWGYAEFCPEDITNATIALTIQLYKRGLTGFTNTAASTEMGALQFIRDNREFMNLFRGYRKMALG